MQIGFVGLGKMGYNLALNLHRHGYEVVAYDVATENVKNILLEGISPAFSLEELCQQLNGRKVIWLMVPAGKPVDDCIETLIPFLSTSDIIIDGGNSNFNDSIRRYKYLKTKGIDYLDCGTSGGVDGALNGACTMIGGEDEVFNYCASVFNDISLPNGWLHAGGPGSGHFVKMVHNGIEYGLMQLICETYDLLNRGIGLSYEEMADVFGKWNKAELSSFLIEITETVLRKVDHKTGKPLVEMILDTA